MQENWVPSPEDEINYTLQLASPSIFNVWRTSRSYTSNRANLYKKGWKQQIIRKAKHNLRLCFVAHGELQSMQMLSAPVGWTALVEAGGGWRRWISLFLTAQSESHLDLNSHSRQSTLCASPFPIQSYVVMETSVKTQDFGCFYAVCVMSTRWNTVHSRAMLERSSQVPMMWGKWHLWPWFKC